MPLLPRCKFTGRTLAEVRPWRNTARETHPDVKPGDAGAAKAFQAAQVAYEVLRQAEERRSWNG